MRPGWHIALTVRKREETKYMLFLQSNLAPGINSCFLRPLLIGRPFALAPEAVSQHLGILHLSSIMRTLEILHYRFWKDQAQDY